MATGRSYQPVGLPKRADGFQSKVATSRDWKRGREAEKPLTVSTVQLIPSAFVKEKSLTTKQTLARTQEVKLPQITQLRDMSEASHHKFSAVDLQKSLFQPFPLELVFQNFVPAEVYEKAVVVRNNDKVPRLVMVAMEGSPYFKLVSHNRVWQKVLPGRTATFRIHFISEKNEDCSHQLTFTTGREKFIVPIRAIGPRAVLDFPAHLDFSICPVNYSTQKTLLIRNVGNREARYHISTQSPFSVDPSIGNLGIGEATQVTVEFHPLETGDHSRSLVVHYDTGEDSHTRLYGSAVDANIWLEKGSLNIENTYLTLANCGTVVLHNQSEITAHFQWKAAATREQEDQQKLRLCHRLQKRENEVDCFLKECTEVPTLREHVPLLSRGFQQQRAKVQGDPMLFSNDIFTIDPVEGDVLPNSSIEINVIFKPQEARVYQQTVYCDISGHETRLPLHIKAEGIQTRLCFSYEQLDIGNVFVGSAHSYEVFLFNKGVIDGAFSLIPPRTALGSCFTFHPQKGIISPNGLQVIKISFSSTILGKFTEEFRFRVNGSAELLTLTIRGCVTGPAYHFAVPSLNFGDVPFGFPRTLSCRLTNTSLVPMTFNLHIPGDGYGAPSVTSSTLMSDDTFLSRRVAQGYITPTEFTINPRRGTIHPQEFLDIQVTLCSNTVRSYKLALMVDVEGLGQKVSSLLLTARCVVPLLRVLNPVVTFGQCFLEVPYQQMLTIVNDSNLPGCYRILPQEYKEDAAVLYSSLMPCGIIQPHSSVEIPFTLQTRVMGEQDTVARVVTIGTEGSPLEQEVHLVSIGEGPVVYVHPSKIDFGSIQVLQDVSQTLHLSNQTATPASFWAEMAGKRSRCRIEPSEGVIPPNAELSVTVIANLDDTEVFHDEVKVFIKNSRSYVIPIQAVGMGTTIVTDKPIVPELNLGLRFSKIPFCYHFKVTNKGRQTHLLCWTAEGFSTFRQHRLRALSTTKGNSSQNRKSACPVFKLQPPRMELMPGKSMEMVVEGFSSTPQVVKERLLCHAVIGRKAGKVKIMQVDVMCEFIAPVLQLSSTELIFRVEKQPNDVLTLQYKPFSLKNTCLLPLSVFLAVEEPFSMCHADRRPLPADIEPVKLEAGEERHLSVRFNPAYEEGLTSREVEKVLKIHFLEHPHKEQVTVRGEVYFPNLHIQTTALDFGCILNDTETVRYIEITNCSPIPVQYRWLFLTESPAGQMRSVIKVKVKLFSRFSPPGSQHFITPQPPRENIAQSERSVSAESSPREEAAEEPAKGLGAAGEAKPPPSSAPKMEGTEETRSLPLRQFKEAKPVGIGIQDVFSILPLYSVLPPGKSQQVMFTFFGHANVVAHVMALCEVEGGPTYEVALSGEASLISYILDITEIDYGLQVFNKVAEAEVTLQNSGKMGFTYAVLSPSVATAGCLQPREPLVLPSTGYVGPGKEQALKVYCLPGVGVFCETFQVQVGHLEPEEISLRGEGDFPRISLDLPRNIKGNEKYERVIKEAKEKVERDSRRDEAVVPGETVAAEPLTDGSSTMLEPWLQMQMEQMLIEEHTLEQLKALTSGPPEDTAFDQHAYRGLLKAELPEYILDFGYVLLGSIQTRVVKVTNTGRFPVSFCTDRRVLHSTGFRVEPDHMEDLPCSETESFKVHFDPESASLPLGEVNVLLPIEVAEGPMYHVRLRANVAMPSLCLSKDRLDFSAVQTGQCQEETVQFHNQLQVPCEWSITISEPVEKVKKRVPRNVVKKLLQELNSKPHVFTALPLSGALSPGQRCNVRVRFSPTEEKSYKNILQINICQSSQSLQLQVSGHGLEPRLEFSPTVLELGPLIPCSCGVEGTVVVKNPCNFPIEFYSLEFDQEYLEEEEILRMLKDYDCQNTLLLPPRAPGEKLPPEVLQYYQDQKRLQGEQTKTKTGEPAGQANGNSEGTQFPSGERRKSSVGLIPTRSSHSAIVPSLILHKSWSKVNCKPECGEEEEESVEKRHGAAEQQQSTTGSKEAAGEQDDSPVYRAIARHLGIAISAEGCAATEILESGKLPAAEQILDDLGLGPSGPPVPPTTFYSVVHYPEKREAPAAEDLEHFILVVPEGATAEEKKETAMCLDASSSLTVKKSEELASPTKHRVKEKAVGSRKAAKTKPSSVQGKRSQRRASAYSLKDRQSPVVVVPPPETPARLTRCRWIVPAHDKVELKVRFSSMEPGQFHQTLHFEILGTKRQYQLQCRGTCLYPAISQDPRLVFPRCRKSKGDGDIVSKEYVMDKGVFHFGPLLCGKSKGWYQAQHCPSNCEKINILNITSLEVEVHFCFEKDRNMDVFVLDPPSMKLKPNEKQELSICAYPTSTGLKEDNLICSVEGNPDPVVFRLCCQGVQVKLEVSSMKLHFDRLLLHRTDSKTMVLRNPTPLPVAWWISGLKDLGEDFSVSQDAGIIGPCSEFGVHLYFKATKSASIKTTFRLKVSDAEKLLGTVQDACICVFAEAYDIALDINLPEGRGGVDFGTLNVLDEAKQVLTLTNKGKYDIVYSFKLETADTEIPDLASHFTIHPQKGMLAATKRPMYVHLSFHPKRQMDIEEIPFLKCQVIDPSTSEGDKITSVIPIRVSAKAAFSKYRISPASRIDFGIMLKGTKKTSTFTLENKGVLPFKFHICHVPPKPSAHQLKHAHSSKSEDTSTDAVFANRRKLSLKKDADPDMVTHINVGMFTVDPVFGSIPPGGQQTIAVTCYAAMLGKCKEQLSIDIQGRAPMDNPHGIPYTLFAESCLPGFVVDDIESIFEEHRICSNMNLCRTLQTTKDKGVFITDENRFIFTNAVVGRKATARFKIQNVNKIPCDVVLSIKPIDTQCKNYVKGIFKVDPLRMCVPSCSHAFATVTFTPLKAENYQCVFEASLDDQASPAATKATKAQSLTFSISGAGNLPQVTVLQPALRNDEGNPLLLFKKLLLGDSEELPLVLHNSGIVPVQLIMDLLDGGGVFFLNTRATTRCTYDATDTEEYNPGAGRKPHTVSLVLLPGESAEFDVLFKPTLAQHVEGKICVSVWGSPKAEINIQLVGDGFEDEFMLGNIHGLVADSKKYTEGSLMEGVKAARVEHIQFGDCHIGTPYTNTFTVTNRSKVQAMRFEWLADAPFQFSPKVGHLHAGCTKDITVTLESDVPVTFRMHPVKCRVAKIAFQLPPEEVTDWDDRLCTVKEVDATRNLTTTQPSKKVIEIDPEPAHAVLEESSHEAELRLSAVIDYAKFKLDTEMIRFKKTLQFQTRMFTFQLSNTGNVALEYNWMAAVQDEGARAEEQLPSSLEGHFPSSPPGVSVKQQFKPCWSQSKQTLELNSPSRRSSLNTDSGPPPFSVEPCSGTIPAGQEQLFQMKFSPVHVGKFKTRMLCSIPNLKPNQKGPEVIVKGRSLRADYHFELEDSDYITAKRRKSELKGPAGEVLDRNTKVIEFATSGVCNRHSRTFMVMNPTGSAYSFQWTCQDHGTSPGEMAFTCLTERGWIQPGEKAEMKFEFIPQHLDITESFWVFTIPELSISVPFLLAGNATDPLVSLDRPHLNFYSVLTGREAQRTIYLINKEKETFSFAFRKSSLSSEGCNVKVEPLKGFISPLSRLPVTVFLKPTQEGEVVLNLKCDVKRKSQPLSLNVKAFGFRKKVEKPRAEKK